jgi:hypothetical protein
LVKEKHGKQDALFIEMEVVLSCTVEEHFAPIVESLILEVSACSFAWQELVIIIFDISPIVQRKFGIVIIHFLKFMYLPKYRKLFTYSAILDLDIRLIF